VSRRPHFRPSQVSRLTREPPFTDANVAGLIAPFLGNRHAAIDPAEITGLRKSWNTRHNALFAAQEARDHDPTPESKEIATLNRHAYAVRRTLQRIKHRRQRELEIARSDGPSSAMFFAKLRLQEIEGVEARAENVYLPQSYVTPDWLGGLLDEIEAALLVTNPMKKFGRSKLSPIVLIAEAAIELIAGFEISAEAIAKQAERRRKHNS
jgi:hypothetical protein